MYLLSKYYHEENVNHISYTSKELIHLKRARVVEVYDLLHMSSSVPCLRSQAEAAR